MFHNIHQKIYFKTNKNKIKIDVLVIREKYSINDRNNYVHSRKQNLDQFYQVQHICSLRGTIVKRIESNDPFSRKSFLG